MSVTFYYSPQSSASRVHWSLEELEIPYEKVRIDLRAGDQKKPEFLAMNPNGKVPTLVLDGTPMFESVAIQIALGERFGVQKGLWPDLGSPAHLQALTWMVWGQATLASTLFNYLANTSDWVPKEQHNPLQAERAMSELHDLLKILNRHLEQHSYLAGEKFSLADVDMISLLGWGLHFAKVELTECPKLASWIEKGQQRPAMKRTN